MQPFPRLTFGLHREALRPPRSHEQLLHARAHALHVQGRGSSNLQSFFRVLSSCSMRPQRGKTLAEMLALTEALPEGTFFQEHSRARELTYIGRSHFRWLEVLDLARKRLPKLEELSCLDVGCSPFTFLLNDYFRKVSALDLTAAYRERCEAAGIRFYEGGVTSDSAVAQIDKVDCVFILEVLEHLHSNPVMVLSRIRSVLKEGGMLVLSTPNMMCLANRSLMLMNRKLHHFTYPHFSLDDHDHGFGHDRIYMPAELREYLEAGGFQRVETCYQLQYSGVSDHSNHLRRIRASIVLALKMAIPSLRDGTVMIGFNNGPSTPRDNSKSLSAAKLM